MNAVTKKYRIAISVMGHARATAHDDWRLRRMVPTPLQHVGRVLVQLRHGQRWRFQLGSDRSAIYIMTMVSGLGREKLQLIKYFMVSDDASCV